MKRHAEIATLRDIRRICAAQRASAELEVERLNARLDSLERRRDAEQAQVRALEDGWQRAVTGGALQLTASAIWSAEILRMQAVIAETGQAIRDSRTARQAACEAAQVVSARDEAAGVLIGRARRRVLRHREEAALEDHAVRTRSGWRAACE